MAYMKRCNQTIIVLSLLLCWIMADTSAQASPIDQIVEQEAGHIDTGKVDQYWQQLLDQYGGYFPGNQRPGFMDIMLHHRDNFSLSAILSGLLKYFFHEVLLNGKLMVTIVILTVFSMILETLQSAFEHKAVSKAAYAISYIVLVILAVNSFSVSIGYAKSAIAAMIHFMIAMVPLMLSLLASMGDIGTATVLHPLIVFMIHTVGTLIYTIVFPLLYFSAVLFIVSSLSDQYKVTNLAKLLRGLSIGLLGVLLTVFLGVISVQGANSAVADGVTIRTAKYVTGNFVPVVGRMFADASDTVIGASLLIKNAVGLAGVVILVMLCAFPAMKVLAIALIYNVSAAVMQPLGNSPIVACLQTVGRSMIYVFAALASVGLMFFLAITIMITAGNVSVMLR